MGQLSQGIMTLTWCYTHEVSNLCEVSTATMSNLNLCMLLL